MKVYVYALLDQKVFNPEVMEKLNDVVIEGIAIYLHENYFPGLDKTLIKSDIKIRILDNLEESLGNIKEITNNVEAGDMAFMVNFAINKVIAYATMGRAAYILENRDAMYFCLDEIVEEVDSGYSTIYEIPNDDHSMASLLGCIMKKNGWVFKTEMSDDSVAAETEEVGQKKSASKALVIYNQSVSTLSIPQNAKHIFDTLDDYFDEIISEDYGSINVYDDINSINQYDNIFIIGPLDGSCSSRVLYVKLLFDLIVDAKRYHNFTKSITEHRTFIIETDRSLGLPEELDKFDNLVKWYKTEERNRLKGFLSQKRRIVNSTTTENQTNCKDKDTKFVILIGGNEFNSLYADHLNQGKYCNSYITMDVINSEGDITDILFTDKLKDIGLPVVIDVNSIVESSEKANISSIEVLISLFHRLDNLDIKNYAVAGLSCSINTGLIPLAVLLDISVLNNLLIKDDDPVEIDRFFECVVNKKDYSRPIF